MRGLGIAINIAILHGFWLLGFYTSFLVVAIATFMFFGLEFLVPGVNKQRVLINAADDKQELLYLAFPLYPVLSRLYYNHLMFNYIGQKVNPNIYIDIKQKADDLSMDISSFFYFACLVAIFSEKLLVIYLFTVAIVIIGKYFLDKASFSSVNDGRIADFFYRGSIDLIFTSIFVFLSLLSDLITFIFGVFLRDSNVDHAEFKLQKSGEDNSCLIDCGNFEIIINECESFYDLDSIVNHIGTILEDETLSLDQKELIFDEYCRNREFTISIENYKLVKVTVNVGLVGFERIRLFIFIFLSRIIINLIVL